MSGRKSIVTIVVLAVIWTTSAISFAKPAPKRCDFNGDYSFFFWDPSFPVSGVGFFSVQLDPATKCRSGVVLPGGILNCNFEGGNIFEDFIEGGSVFLESDGEGTMLLETNSSNGICGIGFDDHGVNAVELDVSVVLGGKSLLFNTDGEPFAGSGLIPQAGYVDTWTGRADKCFAGQISGCYDVRFWSGPDLILSSVGDCTVCVNGAGAVTGGTCRCNVMEGDERTETLSEIEGGGYTLGENCQSSTGYLWFVTSSDEICGYASYLALDFAVAQQGKELIGACDTDEFILNNLSELNAGFFFNCSFEGFLQ
jgi:hypothetical protein